MNNNEIMLICGIFMLGFGIRMLITYFKESRNYTVTTATIVRYERELTIIITVMGIMSAILRFLNIPIMAKPIRKSTEYLLQNTARGCVLFLRQNTA